MAYRDVKTQDVSTDRATLKDTLDFIREWLEHGDIKKACDKFKVDKSHASKMLRGKAKPKADFLKELKDKALKNYHKLRLY